MIYVPDNYLFERVEKLKHGWRFNILGISRQIFKKKISEPSNYLNTKNITIKRNLKPETDDNSNNNGKYPIKLQYKNKLISKLFCSILNKLITASNY